MTSPRHRSVALLMVTFALLGPLATACGDDEADRADGSGRSTTSTTSTTSTPGTSEDPSGTSTAPTPTSSTAPAWAPTETFPTGEAAMAHLVDAWRAGDQEAAGRVAPPDAVAALFGQPPAGYEPYQECGAADFGQQLCAYRNRSQGGFVQFQMEEQDQGGWFVISVAADPTG